MIQKIREYSWKDVLSCRKEIFGFTAIWIILFHIHDSISLGYFPGSNYVAYVMSVGNSGVDIFLFLSAVGLCSSMEKHSVGAFYKNRVSRICLPFLLAAVPYFVWYDFIYAKDGIWQFFANISTVNFWLTDTYPVWYVAFIVVLYAAFPLIYKADKKSRHISTVALILLDIVLEYVLFANGSVIYANAEKALSRFPVFLIGVLMAPLVLEGRKISLYQVVAALFAWIGVFLVAIFAPLPLFAVRYLYAIMSVCFVVVFSFIRTVIPWRGVPKLFGWLGNISLEIYVVHVLLLRIIRYNRLWEITPRHSFWYISILCVSVTLAKILAILTNQRKKKIHG